MCVLEKGFILNSLPTSCVLFKCLSVWIGKLKAFALFNILIQRMSPSPHDTRLPSFPSETNSRRVASPDILKYVNQHCPPPLCVCVCVRACVRAYVRACVRACVRVCVCVY